MTEPMYSWVPAPPLTAPVAGLIASLGPPGGPYLDPPDGDESFTLPAPNPGWPDETPATAPELRRAAAGPPQRWEGGIRYQPRGSCTVGTAQDPCGPTFTTIPPAPSTVKAAAFYVWAGDVCSAFGWGEHNYEQRAIDALLATESYQIAQELWLGTRAQAAGWPNHYLANNAWADVLTNGGVSPSTALMLLEQGLASCGFGQRGAIHCTRGLGVAWSELGSTVRTVNGLIMTYAGTIIIPDAGYDGSSPDGAAATSGHQWAYATTMPTVRRSAIELLPDTFEEAFLRTVNTVEWRARRLSTVSFDPCCHLAVEVDMPLALVGGAS